MFPGIEGTYFDGPYIEDITDPQFVGVSDGHLKRALLKAFQPLENKLQRLHGTQSDDPARSPAPCPSNPPKVSGRAWGSK